MHKASPLLPAKLPRRDWLKQTLSCGAALMAWNLAAQTRPDAVGLTGLRLQVPGAEQPLRVQHVDVQVEWLGRTVSTRLELLLHNPNNRVLQGELQFPLAAGQSVTGFALDIEGELRAAVPIEKVRGREVFEAIVRQGVDPALLQATLGSHHSLRIYPLPAQGTRRVVLQISDQLQPGQADGTGALAWRLGLGTALQAERVTLSLRCIGREAADGVAHWGGQRLALVDAPDGSAWLRWHRQPGESRPQPGRETDLVVQLRAPRHSQPLVAVQGQTGDYTVYVEAPLPAAWLRPADRPRPRHVTLWWDASGSAQSRDREREVAFIQAWLQSLGTTPNAKLSLDLVVLRDTPSAAERLELAGPQWAEQVRRLGQQLLALAPDGASRLDQLPMLPGCDLGLLVSDGVATLGQPGLGQRPGSGEAATVPILAVHACEAAHAAALRALAHASGGALIDLLRIKTPAALQLARRRPALLTGVQATGLRDLEWDGPVIEEGLCRVAAKLTGEAGQLDLQIRRPDGQNERLVVPVNGRQARDSAARSGPLAPDLAAGQWARLRLQRLLTASQAAPTDLALRNQVRELGLAHGLVTPETSLIVLETAADYARYDVDPPAALREAVRQAKARLPTGAGPARPQADLPGLRREWARRQTWWAIDYPLPPPAPVKAEPAPASATAAADAAAAVARRDAAAAQQRVAAAPPPMPAPTAMAAPPARPAPTAMAAPGSPAAGSSGGSSPGGQGGTRIELAAGQPDSPALRRLREAPREQRYALYLAERPLHLNEASFFLDVAELFFADGDAALGARVASNLAEMNLESRTLLRVLAFRLLAAGQPAAAVSVLERVLRLAPDEAQSWRDLGLAQWRNGQWQAAHDQLWTVARQSWPRAAAGVREVAMAELQALLVQHPELDRRDVPADLQTPLPLALRVVLSWDGDDTDVDLAVIDPDGERCDFRNRLTRQGARLTADNTTGFGPEEIGLRRAKPGRYTVLAKLYGERRQLLARDTQLMLTLTTGFGTAQAQDKQAVRRVTTVRDEVQIGQFEVDAP